jgi:hypothetical protein
MKRKTFRLFGWGLSALLAVLFCFLQDFSDKVATSRGIPPTAAVTNVAGRAFGSVTAAAKRGERLEESTIQAFRDSFRPAIPRERKDVPPAEQILLQSRLIVTTALTGDSVSSANRPTVRGTVPVIVQFVNPVDKAARAFVQSCGAVVLDYLPNRALLVEAAPSVRARLAASSAVRMVTEFLPSDKIQPFLAYLAKRTEGRVEVRIQPTAPEDCAAISSAVVEVGGRVENGTGIVRAEVGLAAIDGLAQFGAVRWIEHAPPVRLLTDLAHSETHLNTRPLWGTWGLTGRGQIVSHSDTGVDTGDPATMHPDLARALLALIPLDPRTQGADTRGHGTHTAGLIVGNGTCSGGVYRGTAFDAKLVEEGFYIDGNGYLNGGMDDIGGVILAPSYALGARVHSASWGDEAAGAYSLMSRNVDEFVWAHPDMAFCVAAGNSGKDTNNDGVVDSNAIDAPATAKNNIAVGATENDREPGSGGYSSYKYTIFGFSRPLIATDYVSKAWDSVHQGIAAFSSRGPTSDCRIKPDVVAPGTDIISTRSSLGGYGWGAAGTSRRYCFNGGTSMSTPLVAGGAALMRQYAMERASITNPSAALVRAMLVCGARSLSPGQYGTGAFREIPAVSPNSVEGWGQTDFTDSVHPTGQMIKLVDGIVLTNGATNDYVVTVTAAGQSLQATLAWVDYPGSSSAAKSLVNDYDLELIGPDGNIVYANGGTAPDTVNNTERILVPDAAEGTYTFRVIARECPYGADEGGAVALVLRGAFSEKPVIVHDPLASYPSVAEPMPVGFCIQSLAPLTNATSFVAVRYAAGTAESATGVWQTAGVEWISNACYRAALPAPWQTLTWHYQICALDFLNGSSFSPEYVTYVGEPVTLAILGRPAGYGYPEPAYGTNTVTAGVPVTLSVQPYAPVSSTQRVRLAGFAGTGSAPMFGVTNSVTFAPTQDSTLTWFWGNQFLFTQTRAVKRPAGTVARITLATSWEDEGASVSTVTADQLFTYTDNITYGFAGWVVDGVRRTANPVTGIVVTGVFSVAAEYLPYTKDTDNDGIADFWALRFFNSVSNVVPSADLDSDGWSNLEEFCDNTDPNDATSVPTPPSVVLHAIAPFQTNFPPWTVTATITDNFTVAEADLLWREEGDAAWHTNAMASVDGTLFSVSFTPASYGVKRVEYRVLAADVLGLRSGYSDGVTVTDSAFAIGAYATPLARFSPQDGQVYRFTPGNGLTNATFTLSNLAGPDLVWTASVSEASFAFGANADGWTNSSFGTAWIRTAYRSENGSNVWYCGDAASRSYADQSFAKLTTPVFEVPEGAIVSVRSWMKCELDSDNPGWCWDAGVVGVTTNGGVSWAALTPYGGYPYLTTTVYSYSPFPAQTPCIAGDGSEGWRTYSFPIGKYAGQKVSILFAFGSDQASHDEGWYIGPVELWVPCGDFPACFRPYGAPAGTLGEQRSTNITFAAGSEGLTPHEARRLLLSVLSNADATRQFAVPLTFQLGNALTLLAEGQGTLTADSPLFLFAPTNSPSVTAAADTYYHVAELKAEGGASLDWITNAAQVAVSFTDLRADTTVTAMFAENLAARGTPEWWLAAFGWTNTFDEAEGVDADGDGFAAWQEWLAGTDPTNAASALRFISLKDGLLSWVGGTARRQQLETAPAVTGAWTAVRSFEPPTPVTNTAAVPPSGFYRVRAVLKE